MAEPNENATEHDKHPLWEWIVAAIGLIFVLSVLGFLIYRAASGNGAPPDIAVEVESVQTTGAGYQVLFRVVNTGDKAAAAVLIEGVLKNGEAEIETSETTLQYAPSRSVRRGGLFFKENPQQFQLELRAKGYESP